MSKTREELLSKKIYHDDTGHVVEHDGCELEARFGEYTAINRRNTENHLGGL